MPVSQTPVLCMYLLYKQSPGVTCDHVKINTVNVDNTCTSQAQRPDYCTQYLDLGMLLHWFVVVFGLFVKMCTMRLWFWFFVAWYSLSLSSLNYTSVVPYNMQYLLVQPC